MGHLFLDATVLEIRNGGSRHIDSLYLESSAVLIMSIYAAYRGYDRAGNIDFQAKVAVVIFYEHI